MTVASADLLQMPIATIHDGFAREACNGECPTAYADYVGQHYAATRDDEHRKAHGLYLTPPIVAAFMAGLVRPKEALRLLDPSAGAGVLLCAAVEHLIAQSVAPRAIDIVAYEIDPRLADVLRNVLDHLVAWAEARGVRVGITVRAEDFILAQAPALAGQGGERFDAVIANPPYLKLGKGDPRAVAARAVVHGQPNIYGLFMAVSAALLEPQGDFVFITPRSFASGPYFRRFREQFFGLVRPVRAHVFASRREAFGRDAVLQENLILHAVRDAGWEEHASRCAFAISSSAGAADLTASGAWPVTLTEVIDHREPGGVFRLPTSPDELAVLALVDGWAGSLRAYGLEISTGPVVPFRATEWLANESSAATVPLLWMNHIRAMAVHWPNGVRKPQYIVNREPSRKLLLPARNYVILRRFSAKEERRRLTAAPLLASGLHTPLIGVENHLNYIYRPGGTLTEDEAWGLAALFNSALLDTYFRCLNGNTQVGATELRVMPLPPLEAIARLGCRVKAAADPLAVIDGLVEALTVGAAQREVTVG